jgi:hypothetical protein
MEELATILAGFASNDGAIGHIRRWARQHHAAMVVSGYFCAPGTYWADIIAAGSSSIGHGGTPDEAAIDAARRFLAGRPDSPAA